MKRIVSIFVLLFAVVLLFAACGKSAQKTSDLSAMKWSNELAYTRAQELGYDGTLEEFLAGLKGATGADGVGVALLAINEDGELIVTLTNETITNLGVIKGEKGGKGDKGDPGAGIAAISIENGDFTVTMTDGSKTVMHAYSEWIEEIPATCEQNGMKAHYNCKTCKKVFDANKNEILASALIIPAAEHTYSEWVPLSTQKKGHYLCTTCGKCFDSSFQELSDLTTNTADIAECLLPSTVLITATSGVSGTSGSGFFVRQDGMIVTNYHVVEGMSTIKIKQYGSSAQIEAKLVGFDAECDIAVLQIPGTGYPTVTFCDSSALRAGETAIAIGNPEGTEAEWSVTQGIISSVNRKLTVTSETEYFELSMIQTDAAVNPGNSGGLLCNDRGEVIGIVARKHIAYEMYGTVTIFDEGIGYAIPGNGAKTIIDSIMSNQSTDPIAAGLLRKRPKIGISIISIKKGEKLMEDQLIEAPEDGILVVSVSTNGANGLLEMGDIIVSFDGKRITEYDQMMEMIYSYKCGDKVKIMVYKNGETSQTEIELTLGVF